MFCAKCGTENDDNAYKCTRCGLPLHQEPVPLLRPSIPNYLAQSIIVTLLCCWPFGIPAIVYSTQVNTKLYAGDVAGAMKASEKAKTWAWVSFGAGLLFSLGYIFVVLASGFALE